MLFIHVGLHKTATTYFQSDVFPRWPGLNYIRNLSIEALLKVDPDRISLISREGLSGGVIASSQEKLLHLYRLRMMFPEAHIMISFRGHSGYLNAQYNQYLRYGGKLTFDRFFDLEADRGVVKQDDLRFRNYIEAIEKYWGRKPFVFSLLEVKESFSVLLEEMGLFFGLAPPEISEINRGQRNVSIGRAQAEILRKINTAVNVPFYPDGNRRPYKVLRQLGLDPPALCRKWSEIGKNVPVIDPQFAKEVDDFYAEDMRFIQTYIDGRRESLCAG